MKSTRRNFLKSSISAAFTWLTAVSAFSIFRDADAGLLGKAFLETETKEVLKEIYPGLSRVNSDKVLLTVPALAENGAIVPISVTSTLRNVESIAVIVEKNPRPLAAQFRISPDAETWLSTRIRMAKSGRVLAVVKAGDTLYTSQQSVSVTVGGCNG